MAKSIFKEIVIILLVCVAIALIMAVIFYNYIPTNKIIPAKVTAYQTPENIEAEITENTIGSYTTQDKDYTIDNTDLSKYQQTQSYNPGKPDPFAEYSEQNAPTNETGNTGNNEEPVDQNVTDNYYTSQNVGAGTK
jgi:hypothetical protein